MKYKELKEKVEEWGRKYNYKPVIKVGCEYIEVMLEGNGYVSRICAIHKSERFVLDLIWPANRDLPENARNELIIKLKNAYVNIAITERRLREDNKDSINVKKLKSARESLRDVFRELVYEDK